MKFRKKPVVVEVMQFDGENGLEIEKWADGFVDSMQSPLDGHKYLQISTLEGVMLAGRGDWIIRGVNGEFYPCKSDIFEKTYEEVVG
jgi:hypothetical protein